MGLNIKRVLKDKSLMKPFFSYYGSKYRLCQKGFYPKPKTGNIVIEAFAGSASYSTYHEPERVILIDKSPTIIGVWNYLINAQEADILELPTNLDDFESLLELKNYFPSPAIDLIGFWVGRAKTTPVHNVTGWWRQYHSDNCCRVWNESVKERIIRQLPKISNWQAYLGDYDSFNKQHLSSLYKQSIKTELVNEFNKQTYFIDPPYSGVGGRAYQHNKINYQALASWINTLSNSSQIIACENQDLPHRWANFNQATQAFNMRGKKQELTWVQQ